MCRGRDKGLDDLRIAGGRNRGDREGGGENTKEQRKARIGQTGR